MFVRLLSMIFWEVIMDKFLQVKALDNGTVIDHIPAGKAAEVVKILGLDNYKTTWIGGYNLDSKQFGKKDMIKIEGRRLTPKEYNLIALVAPEATISIIENGKVKEKRKVALPNSVKDFIVCPNPNCITNRVEEVSTNFTVEENHGVKVKCHYCEKSYLIDEVKIKM